jgi:hypothetical protein
MPLDNEILKKVDDKLTSLKQTNPKQYELFNKSLNSSDPFIKNKVLTEFKENPLGYLDNYYAAPKPKTTTSNLTIAKPTIFDNYYNKNEIPVGRENEFASSLPLEKEAKDRLNNFYFLKSGFNPSGKDQSFKMNEEIVKIRELAGKNSEISKSVIYQNFEKDIIGLYRSKYPELANTGETLNKIKDDPKNYSVFYKLGLEYSKITENTPAFGTENSKRMELDLDQIIKHEDYNKPLVGKSGFKYDGDEVRNIKAILPSLGKQLFQKSHEHYLQNDVAKAMKPYQDKLADVENRLTVAQETLSKIKKPTTKQEVEAYNNEIKKLKPLYDEYKGLLNTFNEVDKSVKYGYDVLKDTWKNKSWEEKKIESYSDELAQDRFFGANSFSELSDFNKRRISILNNIPAKLYRSVKGLFASDYQLALDSVNPDIQDISWHTGDFDKDGNPVMSNQISYIDKEGKKNWQLGALAEEGVFQTVNMLGVGKLTGLFAKTLAVGANATRAANVAIKTGEKLKYVPKYSADKILRAGFETPAFIQNNRVASFIIGDHISLGARALTLPAVTTSTYGRLYAENINKFKTEGELKDYTRTAAFIEGLTESIVPDVFFFNNLGISSLGKNLSPSLYKQVLRFVKDGTSLTARKQGLKTLMMTSGKVALNTFQEAIVEEGINHYAMGKYEDYKENQSGSYKRQQEGDFEWQESLATMSLSMLMGVKGNYQQYSQRYNYDFTKPESLAYHRYNVAINADLLKHDIATDSKLNPEQKNKMLEMVHRNELLLKQSIDRVVIPDRKTLGKDEESTFLYFNALSEKTRLEEQLVKNGLSEKDKKKYEDMDKIINQLDAKNNDWSQLSPEQREKKVWQWFKEGITETNELDELEDSPSISYARLLARREAIDKLYEDDKINKKTYDTYLENLNKAEEKITKDSESKVNKNLSRIDELTEKQLVILQEDVLTAKALANDNFESVKIKDLEINSEPFTSVQELKDSVVPGTNAKITYLDAAQKEFEARVIMQDGELIDIKTNKEIPKESTILTAELFENKGKNFELNEEQLNNRLETISRVLEQKTNERLEEERKVLQEKFNEDLVAAEAWVREVGKDLTESMPLVEWEAMIDEYVKNIKSPESANLIKERLLHKADEILNGVEEKTPVTQTETTTEDDTYLDTLVTPESINAELDKLRKQRATETKTANQVFIDAKIDKLEKKLKSTDVADIDFVRNNIREVNGKFRLDVTIEGKKVTLESPYATKEESITFFNKTLAEGTYQEYMITQDTIIQKVMGAMKKDNEGTWVFFHPASGKYIKALTTASLDNPNDANVNKPIANKEEAAKSIIEFVKEYPELIQLVKNGGMIAEGIQKQLDLRLTDNVPQEETKSETTTVKTEETPVDTIQSETETKKAEYKREDFPESQSNTRTPITQKLLDYFAETLGIPKFTEDLSKGTYVSWLQNANPIGYAVAEKLNAPKQAFDVIAKYDAELKALEETTETNQVDLKEERRKELILEEYKPKNVIGYMSIPNRNGSFNSANISKSPNESSSFYQIEDLGNGQIALTFFNNLRAVQDASSAPEITLKSIMNPKDALNQNTKKITTTKPAIFKKEDDKYVLVSKGEIYYSEPIKSKSEIEKINAKYDALEKENNQEPTIDKVPFNIVSLYKDLMKSGVIRYTDENENPC